MPTIGQFRVERHRLLAQLDEASARFRARLAGASTTEAGRRPESGGWSAAEIGAHLAAFNRLIAGIITGDVPAASPAPDGFIERSWTEIVPTLSQPFQAPSRLHPPADVSRDEALAAFDESVAAVRAAIAALTDERATLTMTHPRVGTLRLGQLGDWVVAHIIRHNAQAKRALGR